MNKFFTILFFVLAILYIVSPYDFLPDFFPLLGWIDDTVLLAVLIYYMRNGRLPDFITRLFRGEQDTGARYSRPHSAGQSDSRHRAESYTKTSGKKDPYAVLGVKPGASRDEIHKAYRNLVHQYHPDKVSHLGEEFREMAGKKFVEIQNAYDALTGKRA